MIKIGQSGSGKNGKKRKNGKNSKSGISKERIIQEL